MFESMTQMANILLVFLLIFSLFKVSLFLRNGISERIKNNKKKSLLESKKHIEKEFKEARRNAVFCKTFIDELKNSGIGVYQGKSILDYQKALPHLEQTVLDKTADLEKVNELLKFFE